MWPGKRGPPTPSSSTFPLGTAGIPPPSSPFIPGTPSLSSRSCPSSALPGKGGPARDAAGSCKVGTRDCRLVPGEGMRQRKVWRLWGDRRSGPGVQWRRGARGGGAAVAGGGAGGAPGPGRPALASPSKAPCAPPPRPRPRLLASEPPASMPRGDTHSFFSPAPFSQ